VFDAVMAHVQTLGPVHADIVSVANVATPDQVDDALSDLLTGADRDPG